jgi:hypothetical protein
MGKTEEDANAELQKCSLRIESKEKVHASGCVAVRVAKLI